MRGLPCMFGPEPWRRPRLDPCVLPCGRLLRCDEVAGRGADELRRPRTIITLVCEEPAATAAAEGGACAPGLAGARTARVLVSGAGGGDEGGCGFAVGEAAVRAWLGELLSVVAAPEVQCPVLIHAEPFGRRGEAAVDLAVLALLQALGAPHDVAIAVHLLQPGATETTAQEALEAFKVAGSIDEYCQGAASAAEVCRALRGKDWPQEGWQEEEAAWLKEDLRAAHRLARADGAEASADFWCREMAMAGSHLAEISAPPEAAAALFFKGWALARLQQTREAREALELAVALAGGGRGKPALLEQLAQELKALPGAAAGDCQVVDADDSAEAVDVRRRIMVLDVKVGQEETQDAEEATVSRARWVRKWHLVPAPERFSWAIFDPPGGLLAVSATPGIEHIPALKSLNLRRKVQADGPPGKPSPALHDVVQQVAEALKGGEGCLLHCANGGTASGTALACFLCKYGLGIPEDWDVQAPAQSAEEASELAGGLRGGAGAVKRLLVRNYEQCVQSELVMSMMGRRVASERKRRAAESPGEGPAPKLPSGARVVPQPGDGNCLFHSLAHGLPGKETASALRKRICNYMRANADLDISGTPLSEWVMMSAQTSVEEYTRRMLCAGEWGGAPEIAVCARMVGVDINVYQPAGGEFELVAPFVGGGAGGKAISLLYVGRMHYDALVL